MSLLGKILRWCPQPTKQLPTNFFKKSPTILMAVVLAEILLLLITPLAAYALLVRAPTVTGNVDQTFPLTNGQIKASWPNLPTTQELENASGVAEVTDVSGSDYRNCTVVNPLILGSITVDGKTPVTPSILYDIYLYDGKTEIHWENDNTWQSRNVTVWIQVPQPDLKTNDPPSIPPPKGGFLDTGLPAYYVALAITAITVTLLVGMGYVLYKKGWAPKVETDNFGFARKI